MTNKYGDVSFVLDGQSYTVRLGNLEWLHLQEEFGVEGIAQAILASAQSTKNTIALFRVALSRKHADLTDPDVCNLMDCRAGEGEKTLAQAVDEAIRFSLPKLFEREPADPNDPTPATTAPSTPSAS
jgi:hypothetical protein